MSKKDMDVNERERLSNITLTHCKGTSLLLLLFTGEEDEWVFYKLSNLLV
jgi:hypothetical protein